jgi:hypothetical protein
MNSNSYYQLSIEEFIADNPRITISGIYLDYLDYLSCDTNKILQANWVLFTVDIVVNKFFHNSLEDII